MYCAKCNTNWEKLYSFEEGDESYEYCPNCYTDLHLVEKKEEAPAFIACKFTGKNIDPKTGIERQNEQTLEPPPGKFYKYARRKFLTIPPRNI